MTTNLQPSSVLPAVGPLRRRPASPSIRTDRIYLVYTGIEPTLAAARAAAPFAEALGVPLTVVHFRTVPYPLAVDAPTGISPIETAAFRRRLRNDGLDADIHVYLCRDDQRTMPRALHSQSLVVMGSRRSWWPTHAERSRRLLEAAGFFVVFVETSRKSGESRTPRSREHDDA